MFLNIVKSLIVTVEDRGANVKKSASDLYHFATEKEKRDAYRAEKGKPVVKSLPTETKKVTCSVVAKNEPRQWKTVAAEQPVQQPVVGTGFLVAVVKPNDRSTPRSWSESEEEREERLFELMEAYEEGATLTPEELKELQEN